MLVAVALNLVIALSAWVMAGKLPLRLTQAMVPKRSLPPLRRLSFAAFALGAAALSLHTQQLLVCSICMLISACIAAHQTLCLLFIHLSHGTVMSPWVAAITAVTETSYSAG